MNGRMDQSKDKMNGPMDRMDCGVMDEWTRNLPQSTELECPLNTCMRLPSPAFHIHAVKSSEPARSTLPLGCHRTHSNPPPGPSEVQGRPRVTRSFDPLNKTSTCHSFIRFAS